MGSKKRAGAPAALRHRMRAAAPTWVLLGAVALLSLLTWRQQARLQQAQAQIRLYEQQQPVDAGCACAGRAHGAASGGRGPAAAAGSGVAAAALAPPSPAAAAPKLRAFIGVFVSGGAWLAATRRAAWAPQLCRGGGLEQAAPSGEGRGHWRQPHGPCTPLPADRLYQPQAAQGQPAAQLRGPTACPAPDLVPGHA